MSLSVKTTHLNALSLKCLALLFGYGVWHSMSMHHKIEIKRNIPLCFYNLAENLVVTGTEKITISCYGTRNDLFKTIFDSAAHYNAQTFSEGIHKIVIQEEQIFLPESVRLIHYHPKEIIVVVSKKSDN